MKNFIVFFDWLFLCILTILGGGFAFMTYRLAVSNKPPIFAVTLLFVITFGCFYIVYYMYKDIKILKRNS